jgi:hypothetical protein
MTSDQSSIAFSNQGFITEIYQHRMVLVVKPPAKDIETAVFWPSLGISVSTGQVFRESLLTQLLQDVVSIRRCVTFWD